MLIVEAYLAYFIGAFDSGHKNLSSGHRDIETNVRHQQMAE